MTRLATALRKSIFGPPGQRADYVSVTTIWGMRVVAHPLVAEQFRLACIDAAKATLWTPRRIDSYAFRPIRGDSTETSLHGWALAWDFYDRPITETPDIFGPTNAPDIRFRDAFTKRGFTCGADFIGRKDYPHIEWAGLPPIHVTETKEFIVPDDPSLPNIEGPLTFHPVFDSTGTVKGYYIFSTKTGELHAYGLPYLGRSEDPTPG